MNEVFLTTSTNSIGELIKVYDSETGTQIMAYKDMGVLLPKGVCLLGTDYVIAAEKLSPILKVWPINSQTILHSPRLQCPGKVTLLAASPDGCYLAVGIEEKFHVYQISSGYLVGSGVHHFQPITVIRWCCDGSILACGSEDGMVTVWYLSHLMQRSTVGNPDPQYTFSDHSLPVTDLVLTTGGFSCTRSRLMSVSCDRTCKIYDLNGGKLLLSVVFGEMLASVAISSSEMDIFVGTIAGDINLFSLRNPKNLSSTEIHISGLINSESVVSVFTGHKKSVTCLSTSLEGDRLLSGSADQTVRIWHILSKQCLKVLHFKAPVTNAFFFRLRKQINEVEPIRNISLRPFIKTTGAGSNELSLEVFCNNDLNNSSYDIYRDTFFDNLVNERKVGANELLIKTQPDNGGNELEHEFEHHDDAPISKVTDHRTLDTLHHINQELFELCVKQLLEKRVVDSSENIQFVVSEFESENEETLNNKFNKKTIKKLQKNSIKNKSNIKSHKNKFNEKLLIKNANKKFGKNKANKKSLQTGVDDEHKSNEKFFENKSDEKSIKKSKNSKVFKKKELDVSGIQMHVNSQKKKKHRRKSNKINDDESLINYD